MQSIRRLTYSLIIATALTVSGCALLKTPGTKPVEPQTQQQILEDLHKTATAVDAAVDIAAALQKAVRAAYDLRNPDGRRYISPAQFEDISKGFEEFGLTTRDGAERAKALNTPDATRRTLARTIADGVESLLKRAQALDSQTLAAAAAALRTTFELLVVPRL